MQAPESSIVDDTIDTTPITTDGIAMLPEIDPNAASSSAAAVETDGDTVTNPSNGAISQYTVKPGDTLSGIAQSFGVSINTILWANNITDKSTIKPGSVLVILPVSGIQHTVRSGETLSSIAQKYGGNASDIAQFNGISADTALVAGSTIIIPGGELGSGSSSNASTKSTSSHTSSSTTKKTSTKKSAETTSSDAGSSSAGENTGVECDNTSGNPCHGIYGEALRGFFSNPLPGGALVSQGLHGFDAVDLAVPEGTPIKAAADGTVILSRMGGWNGGYGNYVILDNGSGVETLYAHMTETKANVGDSVSAGEVIGYVGMTGDATGDHLHFEVRGAQNPFAFCSEGMNSNSCFNP
jgi:murein DD-endopeptidase MepM/ murein hydrolase activator NlpD